MANKKQSEIHYSRDLEDKIHRSHLQAMFGRPFQTPGLTSDPLTEFAQTTGKKSQVPPPSRKSSDTAVPRRYNRGMEFTAEATDYNIAQFYEEFHNYLPKVVKVTQGFYGEIVEDTFDRDQVMRIQAVSRQRRVIARMTVSNYTKLISIPTIYSEKLCVVKASGKPGKEKDIFNILKDNTLPLMVQFPKDRTITVGNQTVSTNHIPHMELLKTFDEMYLLGNFITDGVMSQEVIHVPLYLSQLRIAVVTGIIGQPKEKYAGYQQELDRASSYIEYNQSFGNINIAEYDPSAIHAHTDSTYCYVEPRTYSNIVSLVQKSPLKSFDNQCYNPELQHKQHEELPGLYEEIDNTARVTTPKPTSPSQPKHAIAKELENVLATQGKISNPSVVANAHKSLFAPNTHAGPVEDPPPIAPKPTAKHAPVLGPGGVPSLPERKNIPALPKPHASSDPTRCNIYSNDVPRGQIIPTVNQEENEAASVKATLHHQHDQREKTITEVNSQEDVAKLTIDEVADYLKRLNLDQYVDRFKDQMIDGAMLMELNKDILKDDFDMKMIEALRLIKFATTGHVPS